MNNQTKCTINGVDFIPQTYEVLFSDVDYDTGRTADGILHRNRVRASVRKYSISMPPTDSTTIRTLLAALEASSFSVSMPDPLSSDGTYEGTFYCSDRTMPVYNFALDLWDAWTFSIVEV